MPQVGHYGPADLQWYIEHDGTVLAEIDSVDWDVDPQSEPAGAGLGLLKNSYYKTTGAPKGAFTINRKYLQRSDKGNLFLDMIAGTRYFINEVIAASSSTYTVALNTALVGILEVRLTTSNVTLREGVDYTVNYSTGALTFPIATPEAAIIRYIASTRKLQNFLINGGFEDAITNTWTPFATATILRDPANAYIEGYGLKVTPTAVSDGVQYNVSMNLQPGRQYRLRGRAKAATAEILGAFWYDGTTDNAATVVTGATLAVTWTPFEFTFIPTKAVIPNLKIKDSKASPALFYLDDLALLDDTTGNNPTLLANPMDSGLGVPFTFNVIARRVIDGVIVLKLMKCAADKLSYKGSKEYTEEFKGMFLDMITE